MYVRRCISHQAAVLREERHNPQSVSYTHLDVYKRQILSRNPEDAMDSSDVSFSEETEINRITLKLNKKIMKDIKNIEKLQRQDPKLNKIIVN